MKCAFAGGVVALGVKNITPRCLKTKELSYLDMITFSLERQDEDVMILNKFYYDVIHRHASHCKCKYRKTPETKFTRINYHMQKKS